MIQKTSFLDVYALTCLKDKPQNLHESISFRYHLYLWQNKHEESIKNRHIENIETIIAINQIFFGKNFYTKAKLNCTSILDVYALTCLQNKPKNLHESISFRYHLYLCQNKQEQSIKKRLPGKNANVTNANFAFLSLSQIRICDSFL